MQNQKKMKKTNKMRRKSLFVFPSTLKRKPRLLLQKMRKKKLMEAVNRIQAKFQTAKIMMKAVSQVRNLPRMTESIIILSRGRNKRSRLTL